MNTNAAYGLAELNKEKAFGGVGGTKARDVPRIDMSNFTARKAEIADQFWNAATDIGFFQLVNHGIPQAQTDEAFEMTAHFFALPQDTKEIVDPGPNCKVAIENLEQVPYSMRGDLEQTTNG